MSIFVPQGPLIPPSGNYDSLYVSRLKARIPAAGSDTQVQYNAEGVLGASQNFTYDNGTVAVGAENGLFQKQTILPYNGVQTPTMGSAVGIAENYAIIGGKGDSNSTGAVWFYKYEDSKWNEIQKTIPGNASPYAQVGAACYMISEGTTQTAFFSGPEDSNLGAVWVYRQTNDGGFSELTKIIPTDQIGSNISFGYSLHVTKSGNTFTLFIGGPRDNNSNGAVWVYQSTDATTWTQMAKLTYPDSDEGYFGSSVSAIYDAGTFVMISGAIYQDDIGDVVVNRYNGSWTQTAVLRPDNILGSDIEFGISCSMVKVNGTYYAAIGGDGDNDFKGAVWIYTSSTGLSWTNANKIVPEDSISSPGIGQASIITYSALEQTYSLLFSAPYEDDGVAWLYKGTDGTNYPDKVKIIPSGLVGDSNVSFGTSLYLTDVHGMIGAPGNSGDSGAVIAYYYGLNTITLGGGNVVMPGTMTAGVISDGFGTVITGGQVATGSIMLPFVYIEGNDTVTLNEKQGVMQFFDFSMDSGTSYTITVNSIFAKNPTVIFTSVMTYNGGVNIVSNPSEATYGSFKIVLYNAGPSFTGAHFQVMFLIPG